MNLLNQSYWVHIMPQPLIASVADTHIHIHTQKHTHTHTHIHAYQLPGQKQFKEKPCVH